MLLYHGSNTDIKEINLAMCRPYKDFGQGFYLTTDHDFAERWASEDAYINEYELDIEGLTIIKLERDQEWFEYIFENRRARDNKTADVIMGPIANDTIFDTLGIISSGFLKAEQMLKLLTIGPLYHQVAVKTEKAKNQLKWHSADNVKIDVKIKDMRRREQEEYQKLFAARMLEIG